MEVIDILDRPQRAEEEKILATPTVVKEKPAPARRIIGDLSDYEKVMLGLDLSPRGAEMEMEPPGPLAASLDEMGVPRPGAGGD
jgi:circadian clock protein KaiB